MADEEHLEILRLGVDAWNQWRAENPEVQPELGDHTRSQAVLSGGSLYGTDLYGTDLYGANLAGANFIGANLVRVNLSFATLDGANLDDANLFGAHLTGAKLAEATLAGAEFGFTNLSFVDLRRVKGLESAKHDGPSSISSTRRPVLGCGQRSGRIFLLSFFYGERRCSTAALQCLKCFPASSCSGSWPSWRCG